MQLQEDEGMQLQEDEGMQLQEDEGMQLQEDEGTGCCGMGVAHEVGVGEGITTPKNDMSRNCQKHLIRWVFSGFLRLAKLQ
jgi:hypothetical protein